MLTVKNNEIYITKSDTGNIELEIFKDGESYDYSHDTVLFTVKKNPMSKAILIQKTVENGKVTFTENDTNLPYGVYYYDVVVHSGSNVFTVIVPTKFVVCDKVH